MPTKRKKRKRKKPENESYEIEVQNWEVYFHFGVNISRNRFDDGDYSEDSSLTLTGKILSPVLKNVSKAEIHIWESQELDDHWKDAPAENPPFSIGMMQILRDNEKPLKRNTQSIAITANSCIIKKLRKNVWQQFKVIMKSISVERHLFGLKNIQEQGGPM